MRIAHIEAGRHLYGGAVQVRCLADGLTRRGVDNAVLCATGSELAGACDAAQVVELPMRGDLDVASLPRLVRELKRLQPDLVHVHSRRGADLYGGAAAVLAGIPAVVTRRVDAVEPAIVMRCKYRPYRAVIALSRAIERQLGAAGIGAERVVRIPSAVDTQRYRPDAQARERLRAAFGLGADALAIGVVAQLIERKRHAWLLEQLPELVRLWPQVRVICFGRGRLERALRNRVAELALQEHVVLAGFRADVAALLPGLDLLAHPAGREGLGLALVEAASAGVPVVACATGGIPDIVVAGETGVLVQPHDAAGFRAALSALLAAPDERVRMGLAARRHAERRFDTAALLAEHLALYARVLGEPAAAAQPTVGQ
jgi:glycosyltransferase involved in cell wall biosynthesis